MEAQGRRFSGGFPGYDGPAPPRAMRSSRVSILLMSFLTSSFLSACFILPVSIFHCCIQCTVLVWTLFD